MNDMGCKVGGGRGDRQQVPNKTGRWHASTFPCFARLSGGYPFLMVTLPDPVSMTNRPLPFPKVPTT